MVGTRTRWLALSAAALGAVLLASCASGSEAPAGIYGNPPALEDYLDNVGEFGSFVELIAGRQPTKPNYLAIVDRYHESGLEGLGDGDRRVLLAVSQMAFLSHQRTLRHSLTAREAAPSDGGAAKGDAVLEEVYVMWNGLQTATARRVRGTAVKWRWVSLPRYDPSAVGERVEISHLAPVDSDLVVSNVWEKSPTAWTCSAVEDEAGSFAMVALAHEGEFSHFAKGTLLAEATIDQRPAYRLALREDSVQSVPEITYWLDAETLWLRQYEYEEDGIRYTVKLEAVNEDITIEPPDVDVECVEEASE